MSAGKPIKSCTVCHSYSTEDLAAAVCLVCGNRDAAGWVRRQRCVRCANEYDGPRCTVCPPPPARPVVRKRPPRPALRPNAPSWRLVVFACLVLAFLVGLVAWAFHAFFR